MYKQQWQIKNDFRSGNGTLPSLCTHRFTNYLLAESEVFTGKSQTKTFPYWPSDDEVNTARPRFEIFP